MGGAHFTTLIGGVHGDGVTFWEAGQQASSGVELVAELGSTSTFRGEVEASPHTREVIQQGVSGGGTGSATFTISATRAHPLVTLLSMIGPSPDWFVGVSGVSLLDGTGQWQQSFTVDLFPYDAGTEDGTEFSLSNPDTNPQGVITSIAGTGKFSSVHMARLTFTAQTLPTTPSVSLSVSPNPVIDGQSVTVTTRLSSTLPNSVTIPLLLAPGSAESGDYGTLTSITIGGGQMTGTGTISTAKDSDLEHETFTVSLGALPPEVSLGSPSSVDVTIRDTDSPEPTMPSVSLSVSPNPVDEGQSVTVTARLSGTVPNSVTIPLALASGSAESGDYGTLASVTISGGQRIGTGTISTVEDDDEDDETFTVSLGTLPQGIIEGSPSSVVVTIRDEEVPPPPVLNSPPAVLATCEPCTVPRGGQVRLRAEASDPDDDEISYDWQAAQGTFTEATDGPDTRWMAPGLIGAVVIRVEVADNRGGSAAANVAIDVVNRPPVFESPLRFEIAENRDGRAAPLTLGRVGVTDPDGDDFELALVPASDRFALDAKSGALRYIGPGEDFEGDPDRHVLTVMATDSLGGIARAAVAVHVVNVNEHPAAKDDTLRVAEDGNTRVEVLANDGDPDYGDQISVVSVGAPTHGQARVVDAGAAVQYIPAPNYHGSDGFSYVVADAGGLSDTAAVQITVTPVNDRPEAEDDQATTSEDEAISIAVLENDVDIDGDPLRVLSVSPAEHGTTRVAADGASISYAPAPNYHGSDRFAYVVADAGGLSDTAAVEVTVTPVNDRPEANDDRATTAEDEAIAIPVLDNDVDLDGDPLRVLSVSLAGHGTTRVTADGASISYAPAPDYNGHDRFTYVVADEGGLSDTAAVQITVTPVNDGPEANDDQIITSEDEAISIAVLENDVDIDGDPLRVLSVSPAEHGTATVTADRTSVLYEPDADYHGPDRFTYVAADMDGLADTASVDVTVVPVNDGPVAVSAIPDQFLDEGDGGLTVELAPYFSDVDGDPLQFSAESSDTDVVTAQVRGAALFLAPVVYGNATVTVTAMDTGGLTATQNVSVGVSDGPGRAVLGGAFAAMARSYLSSARMTLERRVEASTRAGTTATGRQSGLRIGHQYVGLPVGHAFWESARQVVTEWLPGPAGMWNRFAHQAGSVQVEPGETLSMPGAGFSSSHFARARVSNPMNQIRAPAGLSSTDFAFAWRGQAADSTGPGIVWSLWGQTDVQRYNGGTSGLGSGLAGIARDYDGDLSVRYLGLDTQLPGWLFGIALGRGRGAADWNAGAASGRLSTSMTSVHPYVRWSRGANAVWTTFGAGRGEARNERVATGRKGTSPLDLALGLVDYRRQLGPAAGPVGFRLRADAGWASMSTGEGPETIDDLRARVHQVRLGVDARSEMQIGGTALAPFAAVHARNDGGDGPTGRGIEVSGGLRAQLGIVSLDAQGRWLAFHSATSYGESGASLTLAAGGRKAEGFSVSASPRWGDQSRGGVALWQDRAPGVSQSPDTRPNDWTMDARGAYRARLGSQLLEVAAVYRRAPGGYPVELEGQIVLRLAGYP